MGGAMGPQIFLRELGRAGLAQKNPGKKIWGPGGILWRIRVADSYGGFVWRNRVADIGALPLGPVVM